MHPLYSFTRPITFKYDMIEYCRRAQIRSQLHSKIPCNCPFTLAPLADSCLRRSLPRASTCTDLWGGWVGFCFWKAFGYAELLISLFQAFGYLFLDLDLHQLNHTIDACDGAFTAERLLLEGTVSRLSEHSAFSDRLAKLLCFGPPRENWRSDFERPQVVVVGVV